jgi:hypothetical protein
MDYFYQKGKRALPRNLHNRRYNSLLSKCNVSYYNTTFVLWEDNAKIDLGETLWVSPGVDCIGPAQDRDSVDAVVNIRGPQNAGKFLSSRITDEWPLE